MAIREAEGLGALLKRYRAAAGLTQEELAERAGISVPTSSGLERGLSRTPHLSTIRRLADALDLTDAQRAVFMAAGSQARGGEDIPAVTDARSRRLAPAWPRLRWPRRLVATGAALVCLLAAAVAAIALLARGSSSSPPAPAAVYSSARAPAIIDAWGDSSGKTELFGNDVDELALGPAGYNYILFVHPGISALRFSPNGYGLGTSLPWRSGYIGTGKVDADGNLWISMPNEIRELSPDGRVLADWSDDRFNSGQFSEAFGIGFAGNGDVVIGEWGSHRVQVLTPAGRPVRQWPGPGINPRKFLPEGIALDAQDDIYILDAGNSQVEKYTLQGHLLAIWPLRWAAHINANAGSGGYDLSLDRDGNLYVESSTADSLFIEKLSPSGQVLRTWTSLGPHGEMSGNVLSLQFTAGGDGYIALLNGPVLKVDQNLHILASWTLQQLERPLFRSPQAIAADGAGHVYVTDAATRKVVRLSTGSGSVARWKVSTRWAGTAGLDLGLDPRGNVVVVDQGGRRIDAYSPGGKLLHPFGKKASIEKDVFLTTAMAIDGQGEITLVDSPARTVDTFDPTGHLVSSWTTNDQPDAVAVDASGDVYLASFGKIVAYDAQGVPLRSWGDGQTTGRSHFYTVAGLAVDGHGNVYMTNAGQRTLQVFSHSGRLLAYWTRAGARGPRFTHPGAVAVDPHGNIYVIDGARVVELAPLR